MQQTALSQRSGSLRVPRWSGLALRRLGVVAALGAGAVAFSACGGPSAAQSANQTLEAGISAQRAGNYQTATTDYEQVLKNEPKNAWALYDLGDVEQFQSQNSAAQTHYLQALAVDPRFESAMYNLAIIMTKQHPSQARALYLQVLKITPKDAPAHLNLGKVELALGHTQAARQQFAIAVHLEPRLKHLVPPAS